VPPVSLERTLTPGATRSGFIRPLPSTVTGPRLLNPAITSRPSVAPTETEESYGAGGSATVEHDGPSLPAETDMKMPAARIASTAGWRTSSEQSSFGGQTYELPTMFGRRSGFGLCPWRSVGARKNWRHSM